MFYIGLTIMLVGGLIAFILYGAASDAAADASVRE